MPCKPEHCTAEPLRIPSAFHPRPCAAPGGAAHLCRGAPRRGGAARTRLRPRAGLVRGAAGAAAQGQEQAGVQTEGAGGVGGRRGMGLGVGWAAWLAGCVHAWWRVCPPSHHASPPPSSPPHCPGVCRTCAQRAAAGGNRLRAAPPGALGGAVPARAAGGASREGREGRGLCAAQRVGSVRLPAALAVEAHSCAARFTTWRSQPAGLPSPRLVCSAPPPCWRSRPAPSAAPTRSCLTTNGWERAAW